MKKILIFIALIMIVFVSRKEQTVIIPESSIRFRVIASSNTLEDQVNKNNISKSLSSYVTSLIGNAKDKEEATKLLNENNKLIDEFIKNYLKENNINSTYELKIGRNYFDRKNYKGIDYPSGYYDSLVLSLGNKQGVNWWCVMYPPLCLIDENVEDIEYTTLVKDMLKKYNI